MALTRTPWVTSKSLRLMPAPWAPLQSGCKGTLWLTVLKSSLDCRLSGRGMHPLVARDWWCSAEHTLQRLPQRGVGTTALV